jgi:hypothetical protein
MIPYLEQCLGDFSAWERQTQGTGASDVIGQSPIIIENSEELFRFVKILVTASFFGSPVSKCRAINIATTLCKRLPQTTFEALSIRVQLRKWSIQRLYKCFDTVNSLQEIRARLDCALISTTSQQLHMNVLMGQYVLQRSQEAMDEGKFEEALYILAQYRSLESQREALLPLLIHIARADVLRLQGKFDESRKAYWATLTQYHPLRTVKLMRKIAAVACESGAFSEACRVVSDMMGKRFPSVIEPEKLAFADYHLMLGIWKWRQCLHNPSQPEWKAEEPNFNHAANVYRAVVSKSDGDDHTNTSMMATRNRAWAMIGLAIISHASDTPTLARKLWRAAEAAIQGCFRFWSLHYVQAIILYSLADLSIEDVDARKLIEDANSIYNGRQMYFTGLGTVWADILCVRASKAKRLISLSNSLHHTQGHTSSESLGWHPGCCAELLATS